MRLATLCRAALLMLACLPAQARVTEEKAASIGRALTPMGSEAGANADGSVPAWTPLTDPAFKRGDHPYRKDAPLYTITAQNAAQHAAMLSEGQQALLRTFPDTYRIKVGSSRVDLQACKLEYSIVSPK